MHPRQPYESLRAELRPDDRVLITGASGWMGRSLLQELFRADPTLFPNRLLALGTRARDITLLEGLSVPIVEAVREAVHHWEPTIAVHLAYLTADRLERRAADEFALVNAAMTQWGLEIQALPSLRAFMFAGSGAATLAQGATQMALNPYAAQKAKDESLYLSSHDSERPPTLCARIWSVSGPHCTRPQSFAFTDMVSQCVHSGIVRTAAGNSVYRRYVDAGEFLATCLALNLRGWTGIIDSAGDLIELHDLADLVAHELGGTVQHAPRDPESPPHSYVADPASMERAAHDLGISFTDLRGQILRTCAGLV